MEAGGQVVGKVAAVYAGLLVVVHDAQLARLKADAGEGHVPGSQGSQSLEHLFDIVLVLFGAVGQAGEQAGFGEVGQDQVGLGAHSGHLGGEVGAEGGVELTVVRHHRVHHNEAAFPAKGVEEGAHVVDLLGGGQIAGVDGVKAQFTLLPVGGNGGDLVGEILAGKAGEHGVGGQHRRGKNGALHPHGRNDRQGHRQGALAHTGDVLNADDPFQKPHFLFNIVGCSITEKLT